MKNPSMRIGLITPIITLSLIIFSCKKDEPQIEPQKENIAGTSYETMNIMGQLREFIVHIPSSAAGTSEVPVVFFCHGTGVNGQEAFDAINYWQTKSEQEGFISVYPTAMVHCIVEGGMQYTTTKWAAGNLGETDLVLGGMPLCSGQSLADDLTFFDEMVHFIKTNNAVDSKRFYVVGFSNGGSMASRLAAERSEIFAAAAPNAGIMSNFIPNTLTSQAISVELIWGASDNLILSKMGLTGDFPMNDSIFDIPYVLTVIGNYRNILGLSDSYTTVNKQLPFGGQALDVVEFLFDQSTRGENNYFKFTLVQGLEHEHTTGHVDINWEFLQTQSLP
jgi:poly(3-hydroxybutyrate) depolymerase